MKHWFLILLAGWASLAQAGLPGDDDLLPADQAFAFSASMDGDRIRAEWDVADGYYLYKSKIRFSSDTPGIHLGDPVLPAGKAARRNQLPASAARSTGCRRETGKPVTKALLSPFRPTSP